MSIVDEIGRSFKKGGIYTKLIYLNVAVFILFAFITIFYPIDDWFAVPGNFRKLIYRPWSPITYMFVHGGFIHLFSNLLWLFWFGRLFIEYLNTKQFFAVYIIGGLSGALLHLLINKLTGTNAGLIGASAAVMAIVFAISSYKPNFQLNLVFIGPVRLKYIALIAFGLDLIGILSSMKGISDGVAHFAHLGGAFYGLWFGYRLRNGKDITKNFNVFIDTLVTMFQSSPKKSKQTMKIVKNDKFIRNNIYPGSDIEHNVTKADDQEELDRILDQISKSGYESLSKKDKDFLFNRTK